VYTTSTRFGKEELLIDRLEALLNATEEKKKPREFGTRRTR
jgi:hypothetical protein